MPVERIPEATEALQRALFGPMDRHVRRLRERYGVRVSARHEVLIIDGSDEGAVREVAKRVKSLARRIRERGDVPVDEVEALLLSERGDMDDGPGGNGARGRDRGPRVRTTPQARSGSGPHRGSRLPGRGPTPQQPWAPTDTRPRTEAQAKYVEAIRALDVVFSVGPAGTGKTFLAVVEAVAALRSGQVRRIILTRPAVEAGEKLGFLPGDFHAKINPYLRPLYDALGEMMPWGEVQRYMDQDVIEIVPLAYMRGRTLKQAFIILDEAQNTTRAQMKMFLTRLGEGSKVVVNGDITQVDLPEGVPSGLVESVRVLEGVRGLAVVRFCATDILRHPLVQRIVDAYERQTANDMALREGRAAWGRPERARPAGDAAPSAGDETPGGDQAPPAQSP